jgi:hypothetical protein
MASFSCPEIDCKTSVKWRGKRNTDIQDSRVLRAQPERVPESVISPVLHQDGPTLRTTMRASEPLVFIIYTSSLWLASELPKGREFFI